MMSRSPNQNMFECTGCSDIFFVPSDRVEDVSVCPFCESEQVTNIESPSGGG